MHLKIIRFSITSLHLLIREGFSIRLSMNVAKSYCRITAAAAAAKSLQSCLTLCDPIDGSPSGSPVPGILQARTLEWVAISFSNAWKWTMKGKSLSRVRLFTTPWTAAYQAPLSMGFSRQEYWSGDAIAFSDRITENILNIKAATGVSGALTQVLGSPHQSC